MTDPKEIVRAGYDLIAERYDSWSVRGEGSPELEWATDLLARLPERPRLLELGSGAARGPTRMLAEAGSLTGIDISMEQVRAARRRCPDATFIRADMTEISFEPESFDAVVSVYAFNHLPRADLPLLLDRCSVWLRPGGYLVANFGSSAEEGVEDDWLGVPMFFASYAEPETVELVQAAGFVIERSEVVPIVEPEKGEARFLWIRARKPPNRGGLRSGGE